AQTLYITRKFSRAIEYLDKSEIHAKKIHNKKLQHSAKISKGDIYAYLNQNDLAEKVFTQAKETAMNENNLNMEFEAKSRLANILIQKEEFKAARKIYEDYIKYLSTRGSRSRRKQSYFMWKYAQSYLKENKFQLAKKHYLAAMEKAKIENDAQNYQWSMLSLAQVEIKLGNNDEALKWFRELLAITEKNKNTAILPDIYLGIGDAYKIDKKYDLAIKTYQRAAVIIEAKRKNLKIDQFKIGYFSNENKVYKNIVYCYFHLYQKNPNPAYLNSMFYYDQMARGRVLQELQLKNSFTDSTLVVFEQYKEIIDSLKKAQRFHRLIKKSPPTPQELELETLKINAAKYSLIEHRLRLVEENSPVIKNHQAISEILDNAKENIKEIESGMLIYHLYENGTFVLVLTQAGLEIIDLNLDLKGLKTAVDSLILPFHNVNTDSIHLIPFRAKTAHRLYKQLILPIENKITLPQQLFIITDPVLSNLPFEILMASAPEKQVYKPTDKPEYINSLLLKKYSFSYAPNSTILNTRPKPITRKPNFLIFANPYDNKSIASGFNGENNKSNGQIFTPLAHAEKEAKSIEETMSNTTVFKRENAYKSNFFRLAPRHQIIHMAAHGFVDPTFDAFSGIVLALEDDSLDNGLLQGYEISDLNLDCELVTLSACESGKGKSVSGEGVLGLPRLFLGAGAKRVLMTRWKVDDKFTSELMPEFYINLFDNQLPICVALTKAKLDLINKKSNGYYRQHPFFWASFCLYGEPAKAISSSSTFLLLFLFILLVIIILIIRKQLAKK
ncbi:hypothetical protein B6I21_03290, partial [candidate division KSB1 bacterium 4572_119]